MAILTTIHLIGKANDEAVAAVRNYLDARLEKVREERFGHGYGFSSTCIVYVSDLAEQFTLPQIRAFMDTMYEGRSTWEYSGPSHVQYEDPKWMAENCNSLITTPRGGLVFYFYHR